MIFRVVLNIDVRLGFSYRGKTKRENMAPRELLESRSLKVKGSQGKPHQEELHLYSLPDTSTKIKPKRMRLAEQMARVGE